MKKQKEWILHLTLRQRTDVSRWTGGDGLRQVHLAGAGRKAVLQRQI